MIKILEIEGRSAPLLFCDICEKRIEKASDGEYLIPDLKEGETGAAIIGHYDCTKQYERAAFEKDETMFGNMPLETLMVYLVANLKMDFEKSRTQAKELDELFRTI